MSDQVPFWKIKAGDIYNLRGFNGALIPIYVRRVIDSGRLEFQVLYGPKSKGLTGWGDVIWDDQVRHIRTSEIGPTVYPIENEMLALALNASIDTFHND